ncbi:hypothetical protein H663_016475 [Limnohabitans planktonicus II-D5]|uniref:Uncharacterized protein n=1 Tax=Limnohabitans planktonicus II-D5 TaxID=1293045 RepID=A0A2T7UA80_9BURK|nr:hypothetical protein H663_016475 [Limnohabitans planktonicus II-D5]
MVRNGLAWGRAPHAGVPEIGTRPQTIPLLSARFSFLSLLAPSVFSTPMSLKGQGAGDDFRYPGMRNPPLALSLTASTPGKTFGIPTVEKPPRRETKPMQWTGEGAGDDFWYPSMRNPPLPLSTAAPAKSEDGSKRIHQLNRT